MSKYHVNKLMREVLLNHGNAQRFKQNPAAYMEGRDLTEDERTALAKVDYPTLYGMGAHPFILNGFTMALYEGDRRQLMEEYRHKIAPHGYPNFET